MKRIAATLLALLFAVDILAKETDTPDSIYQLEARLTDQAGRAQGLDLYRGSPVLITLFYGSCQATCPLIIDTLRSTERGLSPDQRQKLRVLMISFDPERDTPQALDHYVHAFDPRFVALRGDPAATQRVAKDFKIYYEKRKEGDTYTVDHSAQSYVFDPQGRLRLLVRPQGIAADLPDDLRTLLKESS